jgi:hypothetical protein
MHRRAWGSLSRVVALTLLCRRDHSDPPVPRRLRSDPHVPPSQQEILDSLLPEPGVDRRRCVAPTVFPASSARALAAPCVGCTVASTAWPGKCFSADCTPTQPPVWPALRRCFCPSDSRDGCLQMLGATSSSRRSCCTVSLPKTASQRSRPRSPPDSTASRLAGPCIWSRARLPADVHICAMRAWADCCVSSNHAPRCQITTQGRSRELQKQKVSENAKKKEKQ